MQVTTLGVITALKNLGLFLASYTVAGIEADPKQFIFLVLIYALISVPTDMYLLNKAHENGKTEQLKEKTEDG